MHGSNFAACPLKLDTGENTNESHRVRITKCEMEDPKQQKRETTTEYQESSSVFLSLCDYIIHSTIYDYIIAAATIFYKAIPISLYVLNKEHQSCP